MKKLFFLLVMIGALNLQKGQAQNFSIKSSLTMLATATANIEVAAPLTDKISLHLPVLYNPWVFKENSRFQQLTVMPGVRLWRQNCGVHYFCSFFGIASRYHMGGWFDKKYRYDGQAYGAGAGVGYSHVLTDHWNLDFELGVGLVWADYDKCGWRKDSHLFAKESGLRVVPAKVDISLSYYF